MLPRTFTSNPVIPILTSSTGSGKQQVEKSGSGDDDDEEKELPSYTRLIPAFLTIGIFFVGLIVIYVLYYQKLKETNKK